MILQGTLKNTMEKKKHGIFMGQVQNKRNLQHGISIGLKKHGVSIGHLKR